METQLAPVFIRTRTRIHTCSLGPTHSLGVIRPLISNKTNAPTKQVQAKVLHKTNQEPVTVALMVKTMASPTRTLAMISNNALTMDSPIRTLAMINSNASTKMLPATDLLETIKAHNSHKMLNPTRTLTIRWESWLTE